MLYVLLMLRACLALSAAFYLAGCFVDLEPSPPGGGSTGTDSSSTNGRTGSGLPSAAGTTAPSATSPPSSTSSSSSTGTGADAETDGTTIGEDACVAYAPLLDECAAIATRMTGDLACAGDLSEAGPDNLEAPCGASGRGDVLYEYRAQNDGDYVFTTFDPAEDYPNLQLTVFDMNWDPLGCDQRIGVLPADTLPTFYDAPAVSLRLAAQQRVAILIEAEDEAATATGFFLTIAEQATCDAGDCCGELPLGEPCELQSLRDCVCDLDPVCCDTASGWTVDCGHLAEAACLAGCGPSQ